MSDSFFVQLSHPVMGSMVLGTIEASSLQDAQTQVVDLLKKHGMPEEHITRAELGCGTITLTGGCMFKMSPALRIEQWAHIIPMLIPYER